MQDDYQLWPKIDLEDLWVYDKLILAKKLGYTCGPAGVEVPTPNKYVVRPITNINGMGIGAEIIWLEKDTEHLPPGHFWCEIFNGRHLSVDYINKQQILCVEGFRDDTDPLWRWSRWEKVNDEIPIPSILSKINCQQFNYEFNCEFIGNKLIEVHFRLNPDFRHDVDILYVVWDNDDITPPVGMRFIDDPDGILDDNLDTKRRGFFTPIK